MTKGTAEGVVPNTVFAPYKASPHTQPTVPEGSNKRRRRRRGGGGGVSSRGSGGGGEAGVYLGSRGRER